VEVASGTARSAASSTSLTSTTTTTATSWRRLHDQGQLTPDSRASRGREVCARASSLVCLASLSTSIRTAGGLIEPPSTARHSGPPRDRMDDWSLLPSRNAVGESAPNLAAERAPAEPPTSLLRWTSIWSRLVVPPELSSRCCVRSLLLGVGGRRAGGAGGCNRPAGPRVGNRAGPSTGDRCLASRSDTVPQRPVARDQSARSRRSWPAGGI